jgi:hypothetical protein
MSKLVVVAAVALVVGGGLAAAKPEQRAATRTLTVVIKNRDYHVVDLAPNGESIGDLRVGNAEIWNRGETRRIGSFHLLCALTQRVAQAQLTTCDFTFRLAGGEITTQGVNRRASLSTPAEADVEPIVGGTGSYAGARGTARLLPSRPDKRTIVLRLLR